MGLIFGRLFSRGGLDHEDDILGCDMAPAPSVLATMCEPLGDAAPIRAATSSIGGPFTTAAQAPIRDG